MASGGQRIVVLGLSLSSSWGNGHATTWRALLSAVAALGHEVTFLERDVPWYAHHRDLTDPPYCSLNFYDGVAQLERFGRLIAEADLVLVGSYVPDGIAVADFVLRTALGVTAFYDIDTPVTVAALESGTCAYLARSQIARFGLYLSFTGGPMLARLERYYGAQAAKALYCSVDERHYRAVPGPKTWELGYLGTYSVDRQAGLERLLIEPARRLADKQVVVAGAQYPDTIAWPANVTHIAHLPPAEHAAFYSSLRVTLNLTRADMVAWGYSPSVRLFEAGACGVPIASDAWSGLSELFVPGREIAAVTTTGDVLDLLARPDRELAAMAAAARQRVLSTHTAHHRAQQLMSYVAEAQSGCRATPQPVPVAAALGP